MTRTHINQIYWPHHYGIKGVTLLTKIPAPPTNPEQIADEFNFRRLLICVAHHEGAFPSPLPGDRFRERYMSVYC